MTAENGGVLSHQPKPEGAVKDASAADKSDKQPNNKHNQTVSVVVNAAPQTAPDGRGPKGHKKHWTDYALALFAFFAIVVALIAASFTWYQGWVARDTEQRQLRAYVSVVPRMAFNFGTDQPLRIQLAMKNFGTTPAYHVEVCAGVEIRPFPVPNAINDCPYDSAGWTMTLYPQVEQFPSNVRNPLSEQDLAVMRTGAFRLYVRGVVHYMDAFGTKRYAHFCHSFTEEGHKTTTFDFCQTHNDAD
jgi:hypothetical protein